MYIKQKSKAQCSYSSWIGEYRHGGLGLGLKLSQVVHKALSLHASDPAVISALQLFPKVNHFGGHV